MCLSTDCGRILVCYVCICLHSVHGLFDSSYFNGLTQIGMLYLFIDLLVTIDPI